ncbi:histidinol phosphate phosphatase [Clostridium polynesiense]|uniref:histidinol phosphate phosphatase n=1 Tax=Clostridium polynesiense TaxID=1325933 RepID=UPI0005911CDF|nr:histidinol phosphate phosphatase [Clostridium polynesiense]
MFDTHMHSKYSFDSDMELEDAVKEAERQALGIILTEHLDLDFPDPKFKCVDLPAYFQEYEKYRSNKILLGIEIGMRPDLIEDIDKIINEYPFDYVIGSVHLVDMVDIYGMKYYIGKSKKEAFNKYLKHMIQCIKTHNHIDSLGHIDYICRYNPYEDKELYYEDHKYYIDELLKILVEKEKAMEINTRRLNDAEAVKSLMKIFKRFNQLGGTMVTVGSDAHRSKDIGNNFSEARELAEACGLKIVYFKNRKPEYI